MLTFNYIGAALVGVTSEYSPNGINRNDIENLAQAKGIAAQATALRGVLYLGIDKGPCNYPRYDVVEAPALGHEVSYAFNGDYYPAGRIVKISDSLRRVATDQGHIFFRRRETGSWIKDGTWTMVRGVHNRLNPEF
jgi:hypothetical protein